MPVVNRNISIDILKFLAVIFITNSHMDIMYAHFDRLATGGAFGDALFFFCSGFTLFLGRFGRFDNWYKRRIGRIYPSVFGWAIVASFFFASKSSTKEVILYGGGWFVTAIMVYYVLLYIVRRFMFNRLWLAFAISVALVLLWYIFLLDHNNIANKYIYTHGQKVVYFIFMLQGAILGLRGRPKCRPYFDGAMLLISIMAFYGLLFLGEKNVLMAQIQILTLLPLLGVVYYLYKLANTDTMERLYNNNKVCHWVIMAVSGLCLEVYLCQFTLITNKLNNIFPLNLIVVFLGILLLAYVVRCIGRWFAQSFRKEDYDWREIVKI